MQKLPDIPKQLALFGIQLTNRDCPLDNWARNIRPIVLRRLRNRSELW